MARATAREAAPYDQRTRFEQEAIPLMNGLYPAAARLTRNHCDAEDLIQETFAKAYVAFHQYTPGTNLRAWLHRILVTTFYSTCRKRQRQPAETLAADICDAADPAIAPGQRPRSAEAEALENLADSGVMRALSDLPERFKAAVYLADVQGYRYSEIADIMGTPLGTVMSRVHRGRQMLRARLHARATPSQATLARTGRTRARPVGAPEPPTARGPQPSRPRGTIHSPPLIAA